jgi:hypothetical protein
MKLTARILFLTSIVFVGILLLSPLQAQALSQKITPGTYTGRFRYSAYNMMIDDQSGGEVTTHIDYARNTYVEGTLILQVDKNGNILPGIQFETDSIPTYFIYTARITPISCSVMGYLEGETKVDLKQNSSSAFDPNAPSFSANVNFSDIIPQSYYMSGINTDCPDLGTQPFMVGGVNDQIRALNKFSLMEFLVVRITNGQFSGTVTIPGYEKRLSTPGGFVQDRDKNGFFIVYNIDLLAPLTDDDHLAPVAEEWRSN